MSTLTPPWWDEFLEKLRKIAELPRNWNSYDADPPDPVAIQKAIETVPKIIDPSVPVPSVHPMPDGGVSVEWHTPLLQAEIEFTPEAQIIVLIDTLVAGKWEDWEDDVTDDILRLRRALFPLAQLSQRES